jgi:hypothetical protein
VSQDQIVHLFFRQPDMFGGAGRAVDFFEFDHGQSPIGFQGGFGKVYILFLIQGPSKPVNELMDLISGGVMQK